MRVVLYAIVIFVLGVAYSEIISFIKQFENPVYCLFFFGVLIYSFYKNLNEGLILSILFGILSDLLLGNRFFIFTFAFPIALFFIYYIKDKLKLYVDFVFLFLSFAYALFVVFNYHFSVLFLLFLVLMLFLFYKLLYFVIRLMYLKV